jgi:Sec7-like guanine-nucleotide exchange factor
MNNEIKQALEAEIEFLQKKVERYKTMLEAPEVALGEIVECWNENPNSTVVGYYRGISPRLQYKITSHITGDNFMFCDNIKKVEIGK